MADDHDKIDQRAQRRGQARAINAHVECKDKQIVSYNVKYAAAQHRRRGQPRMIVVS